MSSFIHSKGSNAICRLGTALCWGCSHWYRPSSDPRQAGGGETEGSVTIARESPELWLHCPLFRSCLQPFLTLLLDKAFFSSEPEA